MLVSLDTNAVSPGSTQMRYYFHIHEDAVYIEDVEGIDLPSGGEARNEAVKAAREMVAELVLSGELSTERHLRSATKAAP